MAGNLRPPEGDLTAAVPEHFAPGPTTYSDMFSPGTPPAAPVTKFHLHSEGHHRRAKLAFPHHTTELPKDFLVSSETAKAHWFSNPVVTRSFYIHQDGGTESIAASRRACVAEADEVRRSRARGRR